MRFRASLSAALFVLVACSGDGFLATMRPITSLRAARARWERAGVDNYEMTVQRLCFCGLTDPVRIVVEDGVVISRTVVTTGQPLATSEVEYYPDVPGLFAIVEDAIRDADDLDSTFDPTYGFPTLISIDWAAEYVDDEVVYRTNGFVERP